MSEFRKGSPLEDMRVAAKDSDTKGLQKSVPKVAKGVNEMEEAANNGDLQKVIDIAVELGLDIGEIGVAILKYVGMAQAAIKLINTVAELATSILSQTSSEDTPYLLRLEGGEYMMVVVQLNAHLDKASKGWVIGDNFEYVEDLWISIKELNGIQIDHAHLLLTVTGYGIGQDKLEAPLKFDSGNGSGPPTHIAQSMSVDKYGLEVVEHTGYVRQGLTEAKFSLASPPGKLEYGYNGANVAMTATVSGTAMIKGQTFGLNPVTVLDLGVSI